MILVKRLANGDDAKKKRVARNALAERFRELWRIQELRKPLVDIGLQLNAKSPWLEGCRAVRSVLHFERISKKTEKISEDERAILEAFEDDLKPTNLEGRIRALVLGSGQKIWSLDDEFDADEPEKYERSRERQAKQAFELGRDCHAEDGLLDQIAGELFEPGHAPYKLDFGRGPIAGSLNARTTWNRLVEELKAKGSENFGFGVLIGALQEMAVSDKSMADQILGECAKDELLSRCIVSLHPGERFNEADFDRCVSVLKQTGLPLMGIGDLIWRPQYDVVSDEKRIELSEVILAARDGTSELPEAYSMKLHDKDQKVDVLGPEQRRLGLIAAAAEISTSDSDPGGSKDYAMQQVLRACLSFDGNDEEKNALIDGLFERVANSYGYFSDFEGAIQVIAQFLAKAFLERALLDTSIDEYKRFGLFRNSVREISPLASIPPEQLIQWCGEGNDPERWNLLARAISPFENASSEVVSLSEQAVALVESSPDPSNVVVGFLDELSPSSWSGSRADIVAKRAAAMTAFLGHESVMIREAAADFLARAKEIEEQERDLEAQRNTGNDPSFE